MVMGCNENYFAKNLLDFGMLYRVGWHTVRS